MKEVDNQFVQIPFKIYKNKKLFKEIRECLPLYEYLQYCIWRGEHSSDKYDLYNNYFKVGLLATAVSIETLAEVHNCCENTIRKWRDALIKHGLIKVENKMIKIKNKKGKSVTAKPYIYILGKQIDGKPYYYANDLPEDDAL